MTPFAFKTFNETWDPSQEEYEEKREGSVNLKERGQARSTTFPSGLCPPGLGTYLQGAGGSFSSSPFLPRQAYFPCCTTAFLFLFRSQAFRDLRAPVSASRAVSGAIRDSRTAAGRVALGRTGRPAAWLWGAEAAGRGRCSWVLNGWMGGGEFGFGGRAQPCGWGGSFEAPLPEFGKGRLALGRAE